MFKRNISQLAVYQIDEDIATIVFSNLKKMYLDKASDIIYITKGKKLYGIICLGDILHHCEGTNVYINRSFTLLKGFNIVKAHEIFYKKRNIYNIPVIGEDGELIGDYSRGDDLLYIERVGGLFLREEIVHTIINLFAWVYVIEPVKSKYTIYKHMLEFMTRFQVDYKILKKEQIKGEVLEDSLCIFIDEEEKRSVQCLYKYELDQFGMLSKTNSDVTFITYASLLRQLMRKNELKNLGINTQGFLYYNIDEKSTVLLSALKEKGIRCFCLYINERQLTEYGKKFDKEIADRVKMHPVNLYEPWPKKQDDVEYFKEFLGDLCEVEDYDREVVQREVSDATHMLEHKKNISGKYFNAKDGRRVTCFQPDEYQGTIYLLGPCTIIGFLFEDQYAPGSYLQNKLLEAGYSYRVENYGAIARIDSEIDCRLQQIGKYQTKDIVIMLSRIGEAAGIPGISLEKIFENNHIPSNWVVDGYMHCNYKVNQIIADSVFEMIEPYLCRA